MRAFALTSLSLLLAASCAAGSGLVPAAEDEPRSVYGAFLAARYAGMSRDVDRSADFYAQAMELAPGSAMISERGFYTALMAGDYELADQAARAALDETGPQLARIYLRLAALEAGRSPDLPEADPDRGAFARTIETMLSDWEQARTREGAREAADRTLEISAQAAPYAVLHKAMLFEAAGMVSRAEDGYVSAAQNDELTDLAIVMHGALLEREGRRREAIALYRARIEADSNPDPAVEAALARAVARRRAPRFTPADYAARSLYALSRPLVQSAPGDYTALFLRLVERADPEFARNRYSLAQVLERLGMVEAALEVYDSLTGTPFAVPAAVDAAWLVFVSGDEDAAVRRAQGVRDATMDESARLLLADIYRLTDRCGEAIALYDASIASGEGDRWQPFFYEGICHQTLGDWPQAEANFITALEIAPNEPRVLNHLGYNWIVFGERVEEGLEMVREAASLAPDNGSILDSVGWGLYKLGRYEEAVQWLERAAAASPGNPTINWHLGDAYARTGRGLQARYSWEHALALDPGARERALIEARLETGLEGAPEDLE